MYVLTLPRRPETLALIVDGNERRGEEWHEVLEHPGQGPVEKLAVSGGIVFTENAAVKHTLRAQLAKQNMRVTRQGVGKQAQ